MTETDAKKRWCPMVRVAYDANHKPEDRKRISCIGPDCMLWRWTPVPRGSEGAKAGRSGADGYCGIAGKP